MRVQKKENMWGKCMPEFLMRLVKIINIVIMTGVMGAGWHVIYSRRFADPFYQKMEPAIVLAFMVLYILIGRTYEGFKISLVRIREVVYSQGIALFMADIVMFLIAWLLEKNCPPILPILGIFVSQMIFSAIWAFGANKLYYFSIAPMKAAVLFFDMRDYQYLEKLEQISGRFLIEKWIHVPGKVEEILHELKGLDVVFIRGLPSDEKNTVLKYCIANEIEVYQYPKIGDIIMSGAEQLQLFHIPVMRVYRYNPPIEYLFVKRVIDILVSSIGIVVLSPLFLITAAAVKFYDGGDILYRQIRLTQNGKTFEIYKFRSMRADAEKDGIARLAQAGDSRITPVGKFIRAVRLDELPQLFNVIKGEMSLVGPRPERPEIAEQYMKEMPEFALRLQAKAGITGYAQIYGKYNTCPYDKLQMDLLYIAKNSVFMDLKLMFATIKVLFMKESTEGIEQGQVTAESEHEGEKGNEI